jgi:hypothetical protein
MARSEAFARLAPVGFGLILGGWLAGEAAGPTACGLSMIRFMFLGKSHREGIELIGPKAILSQPVPIGAD